MEFSSGVVGLTANFLAALLGDFDRLLALTGDFDGLLALTGDFDLALTGDFETALVIIGRGEGRLVAWFDLCCSEALIDRPKLLG
jgi:hypothetical protein